MVVSGTKERSYIWAKHIFYHLLVYQTKKNSSANTYHYQAKKVRYLQTKYSIRLLDQVNILLWRTNLCCFDGFQQVCDKRLQWPAFIQESRKVNLRFAMSKFLILNFSFFLSISKSREVRVWISGRKLSIAIFSAF